MSTINDTDLLLVNRSGSSYKTPFSSFTTPIPPPNWEWSYVNFNSTFYGTWNTWDIIFNEDTNITGANVTGTDKAQAYGVTWTPTTPFYADELAISWTGADQGGSLPFAYMYINGDSSTKHYATANVVVDAYKVNSTITSITLEAGPGPDYLGSKGIRADGVWLVTGEPAGVGEMIVNGTDTLLFNRAGASYQCTWSDAVGSTSYYVDGTSFSGTTSIHGSGSSIANLFDGNISEAGSFVIDGSAASPSTITFTNLPTYTSGMEVWVQSNYYCTVTVINENGDISPGGSNQTTGTWINYGTGSFANTQITAIKVEGTSGQIGTAWIAGIKMNGVLLVDGNYEGGKMLPSDLLLMNRGNTSYKVTGADFMDAMGPGRITSITLTTPTSGQSAFRCNVSSGAGCSSGTAAPPELLASPDLYTNPISNVAYPNWGCQWAAAMGLDPWLVNFENVDINETYYIKMNAYTTAYTMKLRIGGDAYWTDPANPDDYGPNMYLFTAPPQTDATSGLAPFKFTQTSGTLQVIFDPSKNAPIDTVCYFRGIVGLGPPNT